MVEKSTQQSIESGNNYQPDLKRQQKKQLSALVVVIVVVFLIVIGILVSVYFLLQPQTDTAKVRDVFIIFMALESILLGVTLVVLMIQLAKLINLLQHEVLPILESTNETISNVRGTATFLGENITEPVIKINAYTAGLSKFLNIIGLTTKTKKGKGNIKQKSSRKSETSNIKTGQTEKNTINEGKEE